MSENRFSVIHTSKIEDRNVSEIVSGWSLETQKETEMRVKTVSTLMTEIHQKNTFS